MDRSIPGHEQAVRLSDLRLDFVGIVRIAIPRRTKRFLPKLHDVSGLTPLEIAVAL